MLSYREIVKCRACGGSKLTSVVDLGLQTLSGVFPLIGGEDPIAGPLVLTVCENCTLVQLKHSFPSEMMYGDNYGYRSGLNASMVKHLEIKARKCFEYVPNGTRATVLDIGSNDGTLLNSLTEFDALLIGMDPTSSKFREFYKDEVQSVPEFFSPESFKKLAPKADLIFSIAMFYDLDDPVKFARGIESILSENGIWHFEQSYLLSMIETTSYDTICHEHVEYYSLESIKWILDKADLKIIDVELNDVNGGSIAITAAKKSSMIVPTRMVQWLFNYERIKLSNITKQLLDFQEKIDIHRNNFVSLLDSLVQDGKRVWALGASTKGNVLLQYCEIDTRLIEKIVDVNPYKNGRWTPTTHIPIVDELEFLANPPDYAVVLPWHFKSSMIVRSENYLKTGGKLIFPLPNISFV